MTDAKIATLYENYRQFGSVKHLSEKVEGLRKRSTLYGIGTSLGIFLANELSRFALRSPLFKLRPIPILIVATLPTGFMKYYSTSEIDENVSKFWRIHKTREEKGLGGSYQSSGNYPNQINKVKQMDQFPIVGTFEEIIMGRKFKALIDAPGTKLNDGMAEVSQNAFHEDWDKEVVVTKLHESKRAKLISAKKGSTEFSWFYQSPEDTDQKANFGGIDNDNPFHEPPDSGFGPFVDNKLDERDIFQMRQTTMGRQIVDNLWKIDPNAAATDSGIPAWGQKLLNAPSYFTTKSCQEMFEQMNQRREFNILKAKWAFKQSENPSIGEQVQEEQEYKDFMESAYEDKAIRDLKDVFVTDHAPNPKKLHTNNTSEDIDFFNYEQKLKAFHSDSPTHIISKGEKFTHPMSEIIENRKDLIAKSLEGEDQDDEEEAEKPEGEALHDLSSMEVEEGQIDDMVNNKLGVVKEGEEYSYIEDMRDAYRNSLSTSLVDQIFEKIPDHAFYDIKTPQKERKRQELNRFNPSKPKNAYTFFEARKNAEYIEEKHKYSNLTTSIPKYKRY